MATVFERISGIGSTIRRMWIPSAVEKQEAAGAIPVNRTTHSLYYTDTLSTAGDDVSQMTMDLNKKIGNQQKTTSAALPSSANPYYIDSTAKAVDESDPTTVANAKKKTDKDLPQIVVDLKEKEVAVYPTRVKLEDRLQQLSAKVDAHLELEDKDFDKLQLMIYQVIMAIMRRDAKLDQHNMHELTIKIKKQAEEIKSTYNTWGNLTITVISAGISVGGGIAGLAPFFPASAITPEAAAQLHAASQSIGTAGTGLSGIGSIFNNQNEGKRSVLQIHLKRSQDLEEERKGSKQNKSQLMSSAKSAAEEFQRLRHEAHKTAAS
jgi:hypothetical protein